MDNTALARFITSLGSLNSYGSTVLQTKKALDEQSSHPLNQDGDDVAIFEDTLKGIAAVKRIGFNVEGIIGINSAFDSQSPEQPEIPGHLRNAYYNEDDRIAIQVGSRASEAYFPPEHVTKNDLRGIVSSYQSSSQRESDAWRVFADLAKLQPFQDGNKRTALIAANAALGTFKHENYLVLPFNDLDRAEFTLSLMRYYFATSKAEEQAAFNRMMRLLPDNREVELHRPIENEINVPTRKVRYKPQFRPDKKQQRPASHDGSDLEL